MADAAVWHRDYIKGTLGMRLCPLLIIAASLAAACSRDDDGRSKPGAGGENEELNPNVWFGNVEQIASERIGRETVTYVSNIYKYYIAYRLVTQQRERQREAKGAIKQQASH